GWTGGGGREGGRGGVAVAPHRWRPLPDDAPISIGVALADAPEAREALAFAAPLSVAAQAPLQLLTVVHEPPAAHPMFAATGTSYDRWVAEARSAADRRAAEALAAEAPDLDADVAVVGGDPVDCLAAASRGLGLLLLGSRRYGPVRTTLLGSVSWRLIERAACPLIIVPRGVQARRLEAVASLRV